MRIIYYNPVINEPIGAGSHGRGLARALERAGHVVRTIPAIVASSGAKRESAGRFESVPEWLKLPARDVRGRVRALRGASKVAAAAKEFEPDLVIVRRAPYDYVLPRVLGSISCPVIAECNGIAAVECRAYYGQTTLPWERHAEERYFLGADACVAITDEVAIELKRIGVAEDRIWVIHNGVDAELFSAEGDVDPEVEQWRRSFECVVGYCAKVSPLHDLETVARAVNEIASSRPKVGFLFVGPTTADIVAAGVDPQIAQERCLCVGLVRHTRVASLLRGSDLYWAALCNSHGSPLKVFEYLALGHPIVMAATGSGVLPIIEAGAGAVVDRGDAPALRAAVLRRVDDEELRRSESRQAVEWANRFGSWDRVAERLLDGAQELVR